MPKQHEDGCDRKSRRMCNLFSSHHCRISLHSYTPRPKNAAVGEAVDRPDLHDDMRKIFEASVVLRKSIEQAKKDPWVFNGTLENSSEGVVPHELHSMILWILKGMYTVKSEARMHDLNQSAMVISQ